MKITEEKAHIKQIKKAIEGCREAAEKVVNPNKVKYLEELAEASLHIDRASRALNKF